MKARGFAKSWDHRGDVDGLLGGGGHGRDWLPPATAVLFTGPAYTRCMTRWSMYLTELVAGTAMLLIFLWRVP